MFVAVLLVAIGGVAALSAPPSAAEVLRLRAIQRAVRDGDVNEFEEASIEKVGGKLSATYGEITPRGFSTLAARMALAREDVYCDLGSGLGRTVMQAAREHGCRKSVGVELSSTRHNAALRLLDHERPAAFADRCELVQGDIADPTLWPPTTDAPLAGVTCVYVASLLFNDELMRRLADRIEDCDTIRVVATLKRWQPESGGLHGFTEAAPEYCETSWTAPLALVRDDGIPPEASWGDDDAANPGSCVYIYVRD